jgi:catechol 2,3-dioxygenase-like lactoylglutathione lyase family enzyme
MSAAPDLGYPVLDVATSDTQRVVAFYKRLGFENNGPLGPHAVLQGRNRIVFMDWLEQNHINFRGPNIPELARRLTERGLKLEHYGVASEAKNPELAKHPEAPECGDFQIFDPDGAEFYFNTNPGERRTWEVERWDLRYTFAEPLVPVTVPLGRVAVCVDAHDLEKSLRFYAALGCVPTRSDGTRAIFTFGRPADAGTATRDLSVTLLLRSARESRVGLAFLCNDVDAASSEISKRGVELETTRDGRAFHDPDGRKVELIQVDDDHTENQAHDR